MWITDGPFWSIKCSKPSCLTLRTPTSHSDYALLNILLPSCETKCSQHPAYIFFLTLSVRCLFFYLCTAFAKHTVCVYLTNCCLTIHFLLLCAFIIRCKTFGRRHCNLQICLWHFGKSNTFILTEGRHVVAIRCTALFVSVSRLQCCLS